MPLIGVVDPSHKELARDTMGRLPNWLPLDEALAASDDPKWAPWTQVLMRAMFAEHQERDYISTSMLVAHCPRAQVLARREDYVDDLESLYVPWRGTMVHRTMEMYAGEDTLAEYRFWATIGDAVVSCSPDLLTRRTLWDYKVTDNPPRYNNPYTSHKEQVMVNAYIVRHAHQFKEPGDVARTDFEALPFDPRTEKVSLVGLVYLSPKQPKVMVIEQTEDTFDPVTGKFGRGKVAYVWNDRQAEAFIEPRLTMMNRALESYPEWPEGAEELWGGEPDWRCPGAPLCLLPNCLAKRYPHRLTWDRKDEE